MPCVITMSRGCNGWPAGCGLRVGIRVGLAGDRDVTVVGWASWGGHDIGELHAQVDRGRADVAAALVDWIVDHAPLTSRAKITVWDGAEELEAEVQGAGFAASSRREWAGMFRDVEGAEGDPRRTVAGYTIRALRESARELEARVAVHRRAWRPASLPYVDGRSVDPEAESSFTAEAYKAVRSTWLYDAELDLVAVAPDGELAACCIGWFDPATGVTEIEPLGVAPEHRRRGLAVALCLEIAARTEAGGGSQVFVNTALRADYPAPALTYTQAGFQLSERATTYVLPPQDGQARSRPPATTAEVNPRAVRQGGRA
jgi:ribosomal protein S18 acetylase RimI-like enzyme